MGKLVTRRQWIYGAASLLLLLTEVLIALYVHDRFIRPYIGDVLSVICLYCAVRCVRPTGIRLLPLWIFLFAAVAEAAQYINLLALLGLDHLSFLRVLCGTRFSWGDMFCYLIGCGIAVILQRIVTDKTNSAKVS